MRIYDPRIGKFLSVDPIAADYPQLTPYQFASNSPIINIDIDGLEGGWYMGSEKHRLERLGREILRNTNVEYIMSKIRYREVLKRDVYGNGVIGRETNVDRYIQARQFEYDQALGEAIKSGPAASAGYLLFDDEGAFAGQAVDLAAFGLVGIPGRSSTLSRPKSPVTLPKVEGSTLPIEPGPSIAGRVQSRINVANGRTRYTPIRPSTGQPVSAGLDHVIDGHFNRPIGNNRSVFSISVDDLKLILQSDKVMKAKVTPIQGGQFVRTVNVGGEIGRTSIKQGGQPTSWLQVITDEAGNLITTYPVNR